jgi:hypothetical protein
VRAETSGEQFVRARLRSDASAAETFSVAVSTAALVSLQAGCRIVLRLLAHDALLRQRNNAAGVGLLVIVVGLGLRKGRLSGLATCASALIAALAGLTFVWRSVSTVSFSFHSLETSSFRCFSCGRQVVALDLGD